MKLDKLTIAVAAFALAASPALAQAAFSPAMAPLDGEESELSGAGKVIAGALALGALVVGIIAASDIEDSPFSN